MTESDWTHCTDPEEMLAFLGDSLSGRKTRLFVCACFRRISPLLSDGRGRAIVDCEQVVPRGE